MQFLGSHQRESPGQVEPELVTETAECTGAGTVGLPDSIIEKLLKEIEVLLHGCNLRIFAVPKLPSLRLLRVHNFSGEPSLRPGQFFLTTRIKKPERFDLISYRAIFPPTGMTIFTHRLCGMPGDTLELRAGALIVNGKDADGSLPLKHIYKVSAKDAGGLEYDRKQFYIVPPYTDTLYISLEDKYVRENRLSLDRYSLPRGLRDEDIYLQYKQNWNRDHFGPLKIPPGKFFVMGDNRGNSRDSRHLGLVERSRYVGTVWWK
jgi:signal peptidase I